MLSTFGIAVAVAVLLVASSVGTMFEQRDLRTAAATVLPDQQPVAGVDPVYYLGAATDFLVSGSA